MHSSLIRHPEVPDWRELNRKERMDMEAEWAPTGSRLADAIDQVRRSGAGPIFERKLGRSPEDRAKVSEEGVSLALTLNGNHKGHHACEADIVRILNGLGPATLYRLGMPDWADLTDPYGTVQRLLSRIAHAIDRGWVDTNPLTGTTTHVDWLWYFTAVLHAPITPKLMDLIRNCAEVIDDTEMETCGQLHGDPSTLENDGEDDRDGPGDDDGTAPRKHTRAPSAEKATKAGKSARKAKVLAIGPDGRKVYTSDSDARAGKRTNNGQHKSELYVGRQLHLLISAKSQVWTDGVKHVNFGPDVPHFVLGANLVPTGSHRAKSVMPTILALRDMGLCHDVVADPGYTMSAREHWALPLQRKGIPQTLTVAGWQRGDRTAALLDRLKKRGEKPMFGTSRIVDGAPFIYELDADEIDLPVWPVGASAEEKAPYIARFDARAEKRLRRIQAPNQKGAKGRSRFDHPVRRGGLKSNEEPRSKRKSHRASKVRLEEGTTRGTATFSEDALPCFQDTVFATTAWDKSIGRRNIVEEKNSKLHGGVGAITQISKGYTRLRDTAMIKLFIAHTLAGLNVLEIRRWHKYQGIVKLWIARSGRVAEYDELLKQDATAAEPILADDDDHDVEPSPDTADPSP